MMTHLLLALQLLAAASGPGERPVCARSVVACPVTIVYSGVRGELKVSVPRLLQDARIDGALDEPAWQQAAVLTGFSEYTPVDGRPAEDSTEVLVWYSDNAIYFAVRAFEPHTTLNPRLA